MSDLRFALRQALARPLFTALIVGVLALGIGATTAIFSLVDAVLFRPLPIDAPEQVVRVFRVDEAGNPNNNLSFPSFTDLREHADSYSRIAAYTEGPFNFAMAGHEPQRVAGALVTGEYFELFGVAPLLGRALSPNDDRDRLGHPVVVIGESLWRNQFGADPSVIGRKVTINTHPFTVVGVMPARFAGPDAQPGVQAWVPMAMVEQAHTWARWDYMTERNAAWLDVVARLQPGVTLAQANAEALAVSAAVAAEHGRNLDENRLGLKSATAASVDAYGTDGARRNAVLLLGVTLTLLLIAVTNAASLLLVRTEERAREIAMRLGIGATRARLLRMLFIEVSCYAVAGGVLGILLAWSVLTVSLDALRGLLPVLPADTELLMHWRVLALGVGVAFASALAAVVSPARRVARLDLSTALKQSGAQAPRGAARTRFAVVAAQMSLSVALFAVALLLVRSFWHTAVVDPGFDPRRTLVAMLDFSRQGYAGPAAAAAQRQLVARLEATPAVDAAAFARIVPVQSGGMRSTITRPGIELTGDTHENVNFVSAGYLEAMRIPLLRGRAFTDGDGIDAPRVTMINQAFADRYFAGEDPVGQQIGFSRDTWTIVGVTGNIKVRSLREAPVPLAMVPLSQRLDGQSMVIVRGHAADPWLLLPALREAAHAIDPALPLFQVRTLADHVGRSYQEATVMAWLLGAFAALAVVLSAAGLYGLLSWQVHTRTREIGIRLAIGASAASVRSRVIRRGVALSAVGIPLGLLAAAWVGRALEALLYGVAPHDPLTMAVVAGGFLLLGLIATWAPAQRSARIDPMTALRDE